MPVGASVTGRFVTTVTAVGRKTNTVTVKADQRDPNPADNAASAVVDVTGGAEEILSPILECVDQLSDGNYRAHFGYQNDGSEAVSVPIGVDNAFTPAPENRGQPRQFRPGRAPDVFQVDFRSGTLVWTLTGRTSTASTSSKRCAPTTGWLRVDKVLRPANDPGRFNLEIDGVPAGTGRDVGHLGTTGDVAVPAGRHRVGEEGVGGTSLADYDITIACRANRGRGAVLSQYRGSSELVVDVAAGQEVVCTIVNTRRTGPPVPPLPPPPDPTPPGPTPPTPEPGSTDLAVQKFVDRRIGVLGVIVTWTWSSPTTARRPRPVSTITTMRPPQSHVRLAAGLAGHLRENHVLPGHHPAGRLGAHRRAHAHAERGRPPEHVSASAATSRTRFRRTTSRRRSSASSRPSRRRSSSVATASR